MLDAMSLATEIRPYVFEDTIRDFIASLDEKALAREYAERDRVLVLPKALPRALVREMIDEARALGAGARRTYVPFVRRGGAVPHDHITARAPALHALHQSPSLLALFQRIAGPALEHRRQGDPHASALYYYAKRGDGVGWHFDDCGCTPEASFTVIVGLVSDTRSRLEFDLFHDDEARRERLAVITDPGRIVFFCGSRARHRVTRLRRGEERTAFSFVYVKQGHQPTGLDRVRQKAIDTFLYFGLRHRKRDRH
jgi:hypothetical protein